VPEVWGAPNLANENRLVSKESSAACDVHNRTKNQSTHKTAYMNIRMSEEYYRRWITCEQLEGEAPSLQTEELEEAEAESSISRELERTDRSGQGETPLA
jgi:hypothetical protein